MSHYSRRKHRRFAFRYRITLRSHDASSDVQVDGFTKNVSVGGVLLESPTHIAKHSPVSFTIIAQGGVVAHPIEFMGEGRVVRVDSDPATGHYAIALRCLRPVRFHPFEPKDKSEVHAALLTN
jgi:hypothetical protein